MESRTTYADVAAGVPPLRIGDEKIHSIATVQKCTKFNYHRLTPLMFLAFMVLTQGFQVLLYFFANRIENFFQNWQFITINCFVFAFMLITFGILAVAAVKKDKNLYDIAIKLMAIFVLLHTIIFVVFLIFSVIVYVEDSTPTRHQAYINMVTLEIVGYALFHLVVATFLSALVVITVRDKDHLSQCPLVSVDRI
ncbi:unnamed protein product [Bursaphelenchus okinawaensis]|uniref:MARVEL domain-containing protein n=1 Tax=Bursaphelenchus okinawaensis TaxID=465554 RepID=A0A811LES6_9BILA|nr:unnamed protein product [Bursaphelenchus okinawaensis]CAG9123922.1 unnamed protein product [Bursaphelenchus okinawaensis]